MTLRLVARVCTSTLIYIQKLASNPIIQLPRCHYNQLNIVSDNPHLVVVGRLLLYITATHIQHMRNIAFVAPPFVQ